MPEMTCIVCPVGCRMTVKVTGTAVEVTGNGCRRGLEYARQEAIAPQRVLTAVVAVAGAEQPLPVKTARPIPKEKLFAAMAEVKTLRPQPPIRIGQVLKEDLAGTGVALVAAKNF
ncbi:CxxC motif-containing protein [Hydrogenispora ethanolica]|jgi:CxxC motif-containing protein|uniref:CxxC motif-containing protein n=1 Tax=Hydrogenispora ethanolica TaxID=1082276 RepID=A0A4R1RZS7_HYDET|nr:DUF1667 domain-containing protein [Hydrogenispora ethanolica]TCL72333.1 CxxC motif-containing protein [Hydrogenispora ethanolica]